MNTNFLIAAHFRIRKPADALKMNADNQMNH